MRHTILRSLLWFTAITAIGGGVALILGINAPPESWLADTVFSSYVIPGVLLVLTVGGSALFASLVERDEHNSEFADATAFAAGLVLCGWILGELMVLQRYSWLQLIYLAIGGTIVGLSYTATKDLAVHNL